MRRTWRAAAGVAIVAAGLVAAGCSSDRPSSAGVGTTSTGGPVTTGSTSTSTVTSSIQTSSTSSAATTATTTAPAGEQVAAGTYEVYLKSSSSTTDAAGKALRLLTYDQVQFLTGKAAVDTAHERKLIPPDQNSVDDDYLIVNDNTKLRTVPVADGAKITIVGCDGGCPDKPVATSLEGALQLATSRAGALFTITVKTQGGGSVITQVVQHFLP